MTKNDKQGQNQPPQKPTPLTHQASKPIRNLRANEHDLQGNARPPTARPQTHRRTRSDASSLIIGLFFLVMTSYFTSCHFISHFISFS
jgi:hypothetical protein